MYTPKTTSDAEKLIREAWIEKHGNSPVGNNGGVYFNAYIEWQGEFPKSTKKSIYELPPSSKPDSDNVAKLVLDALNGVAYEDDCMVKVVVTYPKWRLRGFNPYVSVTLFEEEYTSPEAYRIASSRIATNLSDTDLKVKEYLKGGLKIE